MRIQCPRCKTPSSLPDSRQGAKVRCGECGREFKALPPGTRGARSGQGPPLAAIIGFALVVVCFGLYMLVGRGDGTPAQAQKKVVKRAAPEETLDAVNPMGWEGASVQFAVSMHEAIHAGDRAALKKGLFGPLRWAREEEERAGKAVDPQGFLMLSRLDRAAHVARWTEELMDGPSSELIASFEPYDGEVLELTDETATVIIKVSSREEGVSDQHTVQWDLVWDLGGWKAYNWGRYLTREEQRRLEREAQRGAVVSVELSDGSKVFERDPEPLEHLDDTPQAVRDEIDALYATMMDLNLTVEAAQARAQLVALGRPALPKLLTGLYETPLADLDDAIQVNMIVVALRAITGRDMGFQPQSLVGAGLGTSEERRTSAIKQWFAWWYMHRDTFIEKPPEVDALEGMIELSEREKRWLERDSNK